MRKRTLFATALTVAIATSIALTGCTGGVSSTSEDTTAIPEMDWQTFFNRDTGKITAIFNLEDPTDEIYRDETFDQKEDFAVPFDYYSLDDYSGGNLLESTLVIGDQAYPTTLGINWSLGSMNWEAQTIYYNDHIASPQTIAELTDTNEPDSTEPPKPNLFSVTTTVLNFVEAGIMSSPMPTPQFTTSGKATLRTGPDFLVQGYASGVNPRDLVLQLTGNEPNANANYAYTFLCATYEISLTNGDEITSWIDQLPVNTGGVSVSYQANAADATTATAAPCDISVEKPLTTKDPGGMTPPDDGSQPGGNG